MTGLVYLPGVDAPFVLDDGRTILLNPSLAALGDWRGILAYDRWHPLVNVSFAIDQAFSGVSSLGFHITNGILHLIVVALVFALASRDRPAGHAWAAFVGATVFGINPLTARSVAYLSARADLLFTAGLLLAAMLTWGAVRARSARRFIAAGAVATAAFLAIPVGLDVPHGPVRAYPAIALVVLAAARWDRSAALFSRSRAARIASLAVIVVFGILTQRTLLRWSDPVALWRAEVERTPAAWDAHLGYADALREAAQCRDAAAEYDAVLRLRPGQEDARRGLARCR